MLKTSGMQLRRLWHFPSMNCIGPRTTVRRASISSEQYGSLIAADKALGSSSRVAPTSEFNGIELSQRVRKRFLSCAPFGALWSLMSGNQIRIGDHDLVRS